MELHQTRSMSRYATLVSQMQETVDAETAIVPICYICSNLSSMGQRRGQSELQKPAAMMDAPTLSLRVESVGRMGQSELPKNVAMKDAQTMSLRVGVMGSRREQL